MLSDALNGWLTLLQAVNYSAFATLAERRLLTYDYGFDDVDGWM